MRVGECGVGAEGATMISAGGVRGNVLHELDISELWLMISGV